MKLYACSLTIKSSLCTYKEYAYSLGLKWRGQKLQTKTASTLYKIKMNLPKLWAAKVSVWSIDTRNVTLFCTEKYFRCINPKCFPNLLAASVMAFYRSWNTFWGKKENNKRYKIKKTSFETRRLSFITSKPLQITTRNDWCGHTISHLSFAETKLFSQFFSILYMCSSQGIL